MERQILLVLETKFCAEKNTKIFPTNDILYVPSSFRLVWLLDTFLCQKNKNIQTYAIFRNPLNILRQIRHSFRSSVELWALELSKNHCIIVYLMVNNLPKVHSVVITILVITRNVFNTFPGAVVTSIGWNWRIAESHRFFDSSSTWTTARAPPVIKLHEILSFNNNQNEKRTIASRSNLRLLERYYYDFVEHILVYSTSCKKNSIIDWLIELKKLQPVSSAFGTFSPWSIVGDATRTMDVFTPNVNTRRLKMFEI